MGVRAAELEASGPRMAEAVRGLQEAEAAMRRAVEMVRVLAFAQERRSTPEAQERLAEIARTRSEGERFPDAQDAAEYIALKRAERGL
jgi:hypothetical protein